MAARFCGPVEQINRLLNELMEEGTCADGEEMNRMIGKQKQRRRAPGGGQRDKERGRPS